MWTVLAINDGVLGYVEVHEMPSAGHHRPGFEAVAVSNDEEIETLMSVNEQLSQVREMFVKEAWYQLTLNSRLRASTLHQKYYSE